MQEGQRCSATLPHYVQYVATLRKVHLCKKWGLGCKHSRMHRNAVQCACAGFFPPALAPLHTRHEVGMETGATGHGVPRIRRPRLVAGGSFGRLFGLLVESSVEDSPVSCGQISRTGKVEFQQIAATRLLYWVQHFDSYPSRLQVIWQSSPKRTLCRVGLTYDSGLPPPNPGSRLRPIYLERGCA